MRLRRSNCTGPGLRRRRAGKGWVYLDPDGERVDEAEALERIRELVIPPAWEDVWICPYPGGHIQATGVDQRGRKQYLYHQRWRERQDQQKFDDMIEFARALPDLRDRVDADLAGDLLSRDQVLACAARLLDRGLFRIGTEDYAVTNETYGLATLKKDHVTVNGDGLLFDYPAKHSKRHLRQVVDPEVAEIVTKLKARRGGIDELLSYKENGRWRDVKSGDINAYLKDATGLDVSAKDFRTWGATVLAAVTLAAAHPADFSPTKRKRLITHAVKQVAHYLGNTPAVARASYIDPRVFDRFRDGIVVTVDSVADEDEGSAIHGPVEEAVLDLITGESVRRSELLERAAA
ncbi:MAG: DNA topoisomerase IB [Solirubrobacteraceae bacterium]